jgi:DNA helicase-2/ATP-dependent DNA helicase PcrA
MQFSQLQKNIFNEIENGNGSLVVSATAGSGKTTTLVEAANVIGRKLPFANVAFLAFNKSIANELQNRLPSTVLAKTVNSFFFGVFRNMIGKSRFKVDSWKYSNIAQGYVSIDMPFAPLNSVRNSSAKIANIIHFMHVTMTSVNDIPAIWRMIDNYNLQINGYHPVYDNDVYRVIMAMGREYALNWQGIDKWIDSLDPQLKLIALKIRQGMGKYHYKKYSWVNFDEQLLIPYETNNIKPSYDWLLVDEVQDLSKLARHCVLKSLKPSGRGLFVGDKSQSIYLFGGADTKGMDSLIAESGAKEMPLSITYRCPISHVKMAQEIDPTIQWHDAAKQGEFCVVDDIKGIVKECKDSNENHIPTLAMGRKNVTVLKAAFALLANNVRIVIRGRDFGSTLANIVKQAALTPKGNLKKGFSYDDFPEFLEKWEETERNQLDNRNARETAYKLLEDKVDSLLLIYRETLHDIDNPKDLQGYIKNLFDDKKVGTIVLSTVHRAKGLEAQKTLVLNPDEMPLNWKNQSEEEFKQEMNIRFVALTRSKDKMVFVYLPDSNK